MDIIELFLASHAELRGELETLEEPFKRPHGVGWDDCVSLDRKRLLRDTDAFFASFKKHEAEEDAFLSEISGQIKLDEPTRAAFAEGRRAVADIMKLFGAVAFTCDGEHVHRVRGLLARLREEVEAHLIYEEKTLFPLLKATLPDGLLREIGLRAQGGAVGGHRSR